MAQETVAPAATASDVGAEPDLLGALQAPLDPRWREVATALAVALRPYTLFREQRVEDDRVLVDVTVPVATLRQAQQALDDLAGLVAEESHARTGRRARKSSS